MANIKVYFGNTLVKPNEPVSFHRTLRNFHVDFDVNKNKIYTLLIIREEDKSVFYRLINASKTVHGDIDTTSPINEPGTYTVILYQQDKLDTPNQPANLTIIDQITFIINPRLSELIVAPEVAEGKKYCSCVVLSATQQSYDCLQGKNPVNGKKCYNPYEICQIKLQPPNGNCKYRFEKLTDEQLLKFAVLNNVKVDEKLFGEKLTEKERENIIANLGNWM